MFVWIYVQPMWRLTVLALVAMAGYSGFVWWMRKRGREPLVERLTGALLLCWLLAVLLGTLRRGGGVREVQLIPLWNLYLGFTENKEMFRTLFMNVLLFVPGGFLGAVMQERSPGRKRLLLGLILLSICIECMQFAFALGRTELDDVLCNGFGALLGIWIRQGARRLLP